MASHDAKNKIHKIFDIIYDTLFNSTHKISYIQYKKSLMLK